MTLLLAGAASGADSVIVRGDNEYQPLRLKDLAQESSIDLNGARFRVAISGNPNPTAGQPCKTGPNPRNRYPFAVERSPGVKIDGGLFSGEVPQTSDWLHTYCNSAAMRLEETPGATVREVRMRRVWDGIRIDEMSDNFRIARVWMSDVRDDCVENDHLMSGRIRDSLFDGCFSGISVAPIDGANGDPSIRLERVLMRMKAYPYRGRMGHAMPIKIQKQGRPKFDIRDSVIAVESSNLVGGVHVQRMWSSIKRCENNVLLWLGQGDLPEVYNGAKDCFEIITGPRAISLWAEAKRKWIKENTGVARFDGDDAG